MDRVDSIEKAKSYTTQILSHMVAKKASDVFLTADFPPAIKVDGKIIPVTKEALIPSETSFFAQALMNEHQMKEFEKTNESNFAISQNNLGRFRVNVFRQQGKVGLVLRVINTIIPKCEDLGLPSILKDISLTKRGLIIFVGGTGSGKSTSLAAMIGHRNEMAQNHIITIEDPIEFVHTPKKSIITQREVGTDTEDWFPALKNTLRQAPDVILIGEVRDEKTMQYALSFAETGHLCMTTLHANSANQALDRIINFFPQEKREQVLMDLSLNLKAFVSQRLIPHKSGKGRVAAIEILLNTPRVADLIFKGQVHELKQAMKEAGDQGMQTFDMHLFDLYERKLITYEEALKNADQVNDLRLRIKLESSDAKLKGGLDIGGNFSIDHE